MIYSCVYVDTDEPLEVPLPMSRAPKIGAVFTFEGRRVRRVPEQGQQVTAKYDGVFRNFQIRKGTKEAEGCDFVDEKGRPCWHGRASAREWAEKRTAEGMDTTFDG